MLFSRVAGGEEVGEAEVAAENDGENEEAMAMEGSEKSEDPLEEERSEPPSTPKKR